MVKFTRILVVASTLLSCLSFGAASGRDAYIEAYSTHVMNNTALLANRFMADGMPADQARVRAEEFMQHGIECHVNSLDEYPQAIQKVMFDVVEGGGSYPDAESALKIYVAEAQFEGNEALVEAFAAVTAKGVECLRQWTP
ncbi:MAG: hypothetical protein AAF699_10190 [Pseudomonadota bacterium]